MIIEITGVNFINKGAELMMRSIIDRVASWKHGDVPVLNLRCGTKAERSAAGVGTLLDLSSAKLPFIQPLLEIFNPVLPTPGFYKSSQIGAIFDASGFAYSDQWGIEWCEMMAAKFARAKKRGAFIFMLPQAFGPFKKPGMQEAFCRVVAQTDLVFARDPDSLAYVRDCVGNDARVHLAPDFTNLARPLPPAQPLPERAICIIPNLRMVDKVANGSEETYLQFLQQCLEASSQAGLQPFLLVHQTHGDGAMAQKLQTRLPVPIPVITESSPLAIKGIIGSSFAVISSRFHGLVSALSQNVPALATGWSHKYAMLLRDYGCEENLIKTDDPADVIARKIAGLADPVTRPGSIAALQAASQGEKKAAEAMWAQIESVLGRNPVPTGLTQVA